MNQSVNATPTSILSSPNRWRRWAIWLVGVWFALYQFFIQLSSGVMVDAVMMSFQISAYGAGFLSAAYYYTYTVLQTPAGLLIDRYGVRDLCTLSALLIFFGCIMYGTADNFSTAIVARIIMGTGCSFAFIASLYLIRVWFPPHVFALMVALTETLGMGFTVLGNILLAYMMQYSDWRQCMYLIGIMALVTAVLYRVIVRDHVTDLVDGEQNHAPDPLTFGMRLRLILRNKNLWLNGLYCGLMFSPVTVFSSLWGIPFLMKQSELSLEQSTIASSMLFIGIAIGSPIVGWAAGRYKIYRSIMFTGAIITAALFALLLFSDHPTQLFINTALFLIGITSSTYMLSYALADILSPPGTHSTSIGFTNSLCVICAPLFQPLVGYLLKILALKRAGISVVDYHVQDYQYALLLVPLLILLAAVLILFIKLDNDRI